MNNHRVRLQREAAEARDPPGPAGGGCVASPSPRENLRKGLRGVQRHKPVHPAEAGPGERFIHG
ncbi:hypothetical protein IMZ38_01465 [Thermosphaera chiliense]|uniref:Uncharacterized protein n=1 Tax=Thermosphaera chiliense TaxID=3402707 RepID=A0A7M1URP2_9CREN|nr:hypothetical protein [Thermosphaera aggregans]QOR94629.1 hypothetical protein IMZ38_01465 [Thermosphaera aggregans]